MLQIGYALTSPFMARPLAARWPRFSSDLAIALHSFTAELPDAREPESPNPLET